HLEEGKIMNVQGTKSLVIASLGDITSDLPQGNDLVGVKRHNATKGYCTCSMNKNFWTSDYNLLLNSHYQQLTDNQFEEIVVASTLIERKEISTRYGLHLCLPILNQLRWERHFQSPHDVYHATSGKVLKLLKMTIDAFSLEGKSAFIAFHNVGLLKIGNVFPFIINKLLKSQYFKQSEIYKLQQRLDISRNDLAIKVWLKCWLIVSKTMAISFKKYFTEEDYVELQECLENERKILAQSFEDFENLPNLHINFHMTQHARNYANLLNIGVGTKEM
ncbi:23954_t:CDS:2, partial [Racocetra persica]